MGAHGGHQLQGHHEWLRRGAATLSGAEVRAHCEHLLGCGAADLSGAHSVQCQQGVRARVHPGHALRAHRVRRARDRGAAGRCAHRSHRAELGQGSCGQGGCEYRHQDRWHGCGVCGGGGQGCSDEVLLPRTRGRRASGHVCAHRTLPCRRQRNSCGAPGPDVRGPDQPGCVERCSIDRDACRGLISVTVWAREARDVQVEDWRETRSCRGWSCEGSPRVGGIFFLKRNKH
mmetsp:Transcript_9587/g.21998  ORF Transcript_9587/g.21998 Transcript_9587/m.21998 type:complete len:231 (-) Transcript_9587:36-728(-)